MHVTVIGTGYVGLVAACGLAELGHTVVGVDHDAEKVRRLNEGDPVIYEPGVEALLQRHLADGRLRFVASVAEGVRAAEVLFLCVGTPQGADGAADMSQVEGVARQIAEHLTEYRLLVEKSTVPVKTAGWITRTVRLYNKRGVDFDVASNPEFLREGSAVEDFLHPDRIVIGADSPRAAELLLELYAPLACEKIVTDVSTAEIIKHASNSFLALKITYINLMADLCEAAGGDVTTVARGMGLDARIGPAFLKAGLGYGGSCFPKDVQAFCRIGEDLGIDMSLLRCVHDLNQQRVGRVMQKLHRALWVTRDKTIALWGLAFKPNTDDVRGAPALALARRLLDEGARLRVYDPQAMAATQRQLPPSDQVVYCASPIDAAEGANALVICTDWDCFARPEYPKLRVRMAAPIIVDGRNLLEPAEARAAGFEYYGVGVPGPVS